MNFSLFILTGLLLSGCTSFVDKVHQQISREEVGALSDKDSSTQGQQLYPGEAYGKLKTKLKDRMPIKDPISYTLSGDDHQQEMQQSPLRIKKRFNVSDFVDSDPSGSLWSEYDDSSSFFATSNSRRVGDIVVIDVMESMKNSISKELRKAYPLPPILQSNSIVTALNEDTADSKSSDEKRAPASEAATGEEKKEDTEVVEIVYDKISSRVANETSKDHVLLKGRKEVYFRNKKRLVEIHALVKKSDIDPGDHIKSDQFIESKISIIQ